MAHCIVHDQEIRTSCSIKNCLYHQQSHTSFPVKYCNCILTYMAEQLQDKHEQLSVSDISILLQLSVKEVNIQLAEANTTLRSIALCNPILDDIEIAFTLVTNTEAKICYFCETLLKETSPTTVLNEKQYICEICAEDYSDIMVASEIIRLESLYGISLDKLLSLVHHRYKNSVVAEQALKVNNVMYQKLLEAVCARIQE